MINTLQSITESAVSAFKQEIDTVSSDEELKERMRQIAHRHTPGHYDELLQFARNNLHLALEEPDIDPFGDQSPITLLKSNIYEHISSALYTVLHEFQKPSIPT